VEERPDYACVLIDLPHHGDSGPGTGDASIAGMARDVSGWCDAMGLVPDAVLGHSFGGKVALAMADRRSDRPLQVWVIDSTPDAREPSGSAWDLLTTVRRLPTTFPSRDAFVSALEAAGWAAGLARWMATNLERTDQTFAWRLNFDVMERLLLDFFSVDLWSVVEARAPDRTVHFIRATESNVMSEAAVRRAESAGSHVHALPGGHWIHTERPADVVALLVSALSAATHLGRWD
jgi:pimeloyl-ACP methyl ester carboxylesterase